MFHLDHAVDDWCQSVHTRKWNRAAKVDELKDHLHCEIERLQKNGMSEEEAFHVATEHMGTIDSLQNELKKENHTLLSLMHDTQEIENHYLEHWRIRMKPTQAALLNIIMSLFFAVTILLVDVMLDSTTVTYILVAVWMVPFTLISVIGWKGREVSKQHGIL